MDQYGHGRGTTQGGFSHYSVVKAKYCYQLKTDISTTEAVLLEPMGKEKAMRARLENSALLFTVLFT
jgi:threonine dehydrogenase-like Zn-dependent dehydrogenase